MTDFAVAQPELVAHARTHNLGDLLRRTALRHPDKLGLVGGDVRWTYRTLDDSVNRAANAIGEQGIAQGERVALLARNCWQYPVLVFALARLGVVLVPVNFMLTAADVAYILDHSGAVGLISGDDFAAVADEAVRLAGTPVRLRATCDDVVTWIGHPDAREPDVFVGDDDPVRLMYTSGTESRPKGAMLSGRTLIAQYVSCIVDGNMTADDIDLHTLPLYHCAQLDCFVGPDVYLGATNVILPRPDPEAVLRTIEAERVTKFFAPPTVWISLLRSPVFDEVDLSSLRKGYYGASPMPVEVLREMRQRLPNVRLWNCYGQTEMAPLATMLQPEDQESRAGSAGRPVLNVETKIVDDDNNDVPRGEVGEIVHRGPHATLGYWNDEEKTEEAFRGGWFHSGDLGVMSEDGYLTIVDRKKDMIKTGGENVASREVEEAIYLYEGVAEVAVFGVFDPRWIEAVVATVVPKAGASLTAADVVAHCRASLAGYKVPKHVVLVDELPKNPSGKIMKRELREQFASLTQTTSPSA